MKNLSVLARLYVAAVLLAGAGMVVFFSPRSLDHPLLFLSLLLLSSTASALKVNLPLTSSGSTMLVSYAVDFAALLLFGADAAMIVSAASAWSQCTFRAQTRPPIHRTLFSMASLVLTVKATGVIYTRLGGPPFGPDFTLVSIARPLMVAATVYFLSNTAFVATVIGLSTR